MSDEFRRGSPMHDDEFDTCTSCDCGLSTAEPFDDMATPRSLLSDASVLRQGLQHENIHYMTAHRRHFDVSHGLGARLLSFLLRVEWYFANIESPHRQPPRPGVSAPLGGHQEDHTMSMDHGEYEDLPSHLTHILAEVQVMARTTWNAIEGSGCRHDALRDVQIMMSLIRKKAYEGQQLLVERERELNAPSAVSPDDDGDDDVKFPF